MEKVIGGVNHEFAKVDDIWVGVKPVTREQYYGGGADADESPITNLTRKEVLAWCCGHGARLLTDEEWDRAADAGIIYGQVKEGDVWEEVAGEKRVLRGGCWTFNSYDYRAHFRTTRYPGFRLDSAGFRVVYEGEDK